jgi:hypothetical protein
MANRLAYEVDPALKRMLLRFWGVKSLDKFFTEAPSFERAFRPLLTLEAPARKALAACVRAWRTHGHLQSREGKLNWNETLPSAVQAASLAETGGLALIENLYLVEWIRDRTNLVSENDRVLPTPFLRQLISGRWSPDEHKEDGPHPATACPPEGREFVRRVYEAGWWRESVPENIDLSSLLLSGQLLAGFDHDGHPSLFAPAWPTDEGVLEEMETTLVYEALERPALFLHQLHLRLYGSTPKKLLEEDRQAGLFPLPDDASADRMLTRFGRHPRRFARVPLVLQYRRLVAHSSPNLPVFIRRLLSAIGSREIFTLPTLRRALSREALTAGPLPMSLEEGLDAMESIGLALRAPGRVAFAPTFLSGVAGTRKPAPVPHEDRLVMDTDLAITLYRNAVSPERLHFLLSIGAAKKAEHLWTIRLDVARIPFHLWLGRGPGRARAFFRRHAPSYWNATAQDHLDQLFRQCESVRGGIRRLLTTWSRSSLERMRQALEAERIPFRVEEAARAGEGHVLVFERAAFYRKARRVLRQRRIPLV